jgi:hypothetical protein
MKKFGFESDCHLHEFGTKIFELCGADGGAQPPNKTGKEKWHDVDTGSTTPANLCFRALWVHALLTEGIKLHPHTILQFPPKEYSSWAVGSLVYDANYYPFRHQFGPGVSLLARPGPTSRDNESQNDFIKEFTALLPTILTLIVGFGLGHAKASCRWLRFLRGGAESQAFHYRILD